MAQRTSLMTGATVLAALVVARPSVQARIAPWPAFVPLEPYSNAWLMTFHGDDGTTSPPQLWEDSLEHITWHGKPALRRVQIEHRLVPVGGYQVIVNVFDPATLAPYMSEQRQRNGMFVRREYDGVSVREIRSVRSSSASSATAGAMMDSVTRDYTVAAPFIDFYGGMFAMVFAAKPLKVGMKGSFPALIAPDTIVNVPFTVLAREAVRGMGGASTMAFKVDMGLANGVGSSGGMYTGWIIDRPPYVLRLTTPQGNPAGYWSWDEKP